MMKSKFLAMTLSAVALTACNNDEVLEVNRGRGISFQVATEASTRAQATTTNSIERFKVWGFTEGNTLMGGIEVSKAGGKWSYGDAIFWPEGDVDFYSVSPSENIGGTVDITNDAQKITNFTVNADQDKQIDLLYAVNKGENKESHETDPVKVNFRHALSQIVFKAKNTNNNLSVDIKGVRVAKVVTGGDFTFPTGSTSNQLTETPGDSKTEDDNSWGKWTLGSEKGFYAAGITETTNITSTSDVKELTSADGALMLMPQKITGWNIAGDNGESGATGRGSYFLVSCKIYNVSGDDKVLLWPTKDEYREVAIPVADITWQQGKKYIYTFIFGEGGGYVPPTDPEDPDKDPDPENPDPGKPVLVPISFEVTVDDFQNGNDDNKDIEMIQKDEDGE